ncbi:hypothetical protein RN001_015614 [Aquatica leii]|uniref:KN motif and ankyrin repeat domain-containing protein 1 n=1 Tax=Aquatica leii TaxID=1421715 RepID=A0AAN7PXK1_9COLE|nr:hypothetical protein RN001_015614 [Aquatica leii]
MPYSQQMSVHSCKTDNYDYNSWYQLCNCCPYGYHIDLDFVRYCESIGQQSDRTGSIKRRRDRRRQRQSMEVLLGLEPPILAALEKVHQKTIEEECLNLSLKQSSLMHDDLDEVVSDFERTLQRSKTKKISNNLPDVTVHDTIHRVPSISSMSSTSGSSMTVLPSATEATSGREYDAISIESFGLNPAALQNIREQMALSLERTKELEERVKLIPSLQAQLSVLKEEKRQLLLEIKAAHNAELNVVNGNYINNSVTLPHVRLRSHSLTHSTSVESINKREHRFSPVPRRDFGVMCSVLTRNVGVGHHYPNTKSVATTTVNGAVDDNYTDKWYKEKIKFLTTDNRSKPLSKFSMNETKVHPIVVARGTQTPQPVEKREISSQTISDPKVQSVNNFTQTLEVKKAYCSIGVSATVATSHASSEAFVPTQSLGSSDDTIDAIMCVNCADNNKQHGGTTSTISLASLAFPRSKSFNLGDDKLNLASRSRTVGSQYEPFNCHKACQHDIKTQSKACQNDVKTTHKGVQYESFSVTKFTDTKDLKVALRDAGCNTETVEKQTYDIGINTRLLEETDSCANCLKQEKEELVKKDDSFVASKIPRPLVPTTPVEIRKFRRQDTYTKIPSSEKEASGLSGLDLSPKHDNELSSPLEKVKQSYKLSKISSTSQNGVGTSKSEQQDSTLSLPDSDLCQSNAQGHRKKVKPSKEMQAAMKVLNDSLQKGQTKNLKNQLKNAINIIQQEWFQISSLINANPLDVEDYLDCFEDISSDLLHYIVNMVDVSGNTAMHYAVSHGNFDVVSILLDSKVCDINQPNKAGYTSVMLVSLAEVCSSTHANVVRRLFQLADVNIRAKQHGQTALMLAVSHGRLDTVQMLLEAGAEINIQDEDGSTALMCASEHGHIEIVKHFLSQHDCDSTIMDIDGSTALKIAMEAGHRHIGVLLYAHERNLHGGSKLKRNKSTSLSPKVPSSPLPMRSSHRALTDIKPSK